jgi:hypothetical protein
VQELLKWSLKIDWPKLDWNFYFTPKWSFLKLPTSSKLPILRNLNLFMHNPSWQCHEQFCIIFVSVCKAEVLLSKVASFTLWPNLNSLLYDLISSSIFNNFVFVKSLWKCNFAFNWVFNKETKSLTRKNSLHSNHEVNIYQLATLTKFF